MSGQSRQKLVIIAIFFTYTYLHIPTVTNRLKKHPRERPTGPDRLKRDCRDFTAEWAMSLILDNHWWLGWRCWTEFGNGTKKASSSLLEWQESNLEFPAKVAGRFDKPIMLQNPKLLLHTSKLSQLFHTRKQTKPPKTTALLRQDSHLSATFLHVHFCNKIWLYKNKSSPFCVKLIGSSLA